MREHNGRPPDKSAAVRTAQISTHA